ncbi:iron-containing alcohol dehydrogenase [Lonepinella koalarum]|uniref:Alcohol dehydrogenase class IV n=1 Tax=Lonepinella koalarum TaxID=53417 RepID=A0A4R1L2R2_9PAST|nr:iron-containing alcohol dehydrogenase [Lonepinella koalarum]MDH2926052.1 alcohol dehydrogenase [Lonepinella koalarum]TCK71203.1 alcohol dehydrogenase class IV [Lonepinella koalarum]TFJ90929.1 iron-containing alcohol dehydrogenase [Lonepinella koalarum]
MTAIYSLFNPSKVIGGAGSLSQIADVIKGYNATNVVLITDEGVFKAGLINNPKQLLEQAGIGVHIISNVPPEPPISAVNEIFEQSVKCNAEAVIGLGGGSAMDTAKLVALMLNNKDIALTEVTSGTKKFVHRSLPTLMIPTTSGTGSEATQNSIVLDTERELKIGVVDEKLVASAVILDAELTLSLPKHITANTGIDALCHAIECYISKKSSPFSEMFALKAVELITKNIRTAFNHGTDIQARENMLLGSFLGGACIATSSTVAVHALSYPLGGKYHIPHGLSNAILLPDVMKFNLPVCEEKFANVAFAMGLDVQGLTLRQAAEKMIDELYALIRDLEIKCDLTAVGINEDVLDELSEAALSVKRLLDNNPKPMNKDDIKTIYRKLIA